MHKTANVLNKLPKSVQPRAKQHLQDIWMAETRAVAEKAFDFFLEAYGPKYDKAVACLAKERSSTGSSTRIAPTGTGVCPAHTLIKVTAAIEGSTLGLV